MTLTTFIKNLHPQACLGVDLHSDTKFNEKLFNHLAHNNYNVKVIDTTHLTSYEVAFNKINSIRTELPDSEKTMLVLTKGPSSRREDEPEVTQMLYFQLRQDGYNFLIDNAMVEGLEGKCEPLRNRVKEVEQGDILSMLKVGNNITAIREKAATSIDNTPKNTL